MRIGIDARMYSSRFTGIGRYVFELVKGLAALDTKNEYVLFMNEPHFSETELSGKRMMKALADAAHYTLREQTHFPRVLNNHDLDLMHFTHFNAPLFYRKKSIVTIHDLTLSFFSGKKKTNIIHRLAYNIIVRSIAKRAARIIAVSENTKKDTMRLFHAPAEKIRVIHEGVDALFHPMQDRSLREQFLRRMEFKRPFILYAGVWRSHKNLVNLIRAFAIARNKHNIDCMLVITGKDDPWYPEVRATVRKEHLEGDVRFTGFVSEEDLVMLYNAATLFVLPSLYEGFGLPVLEAFACGTPVCASRASCLPEICGEGNALFFDPNDIDDIAEKIARLYRDTTLQENLRRRGLRRAKAFSWQKMVRETMEVYSV